MHVFRLWQSDSRSVHPACGAGLGVACVLPQVRRLWSYAGGDAHLFRTRWKNLLQDGLSQVRLGHAQALKFLYIRLHCLLCCYEYRGLCFLSIIYMLFLSPQIILNIETHQLNILKKLLKTTAQTLIAHISQS